MARGPPRPRRDSWARRRRPAHAARESAAVGAAVRALAGDVMHESLCVFHLHTPKCAGTFVWRFFRDKFCSEEETCKRGTPRPPPYKVRGIR